jgi:hypothetical protein
MRKIMFLAFLLALCSVISAQAQQGRCSHHGGVCGCRCCDGSALSAACSPFFPCGGSTPTAPSSLTASALSGTRCSLSWLDNSSNETSFRIEGKNSAQFSFQEVGSVAANITTAIVGELTPETTYTFRVRARGSNGDSNYTGDTIVTTPAEVSVCAAPALCFNGNRFKLEARWQTKDGASGNATVVQLSSDSGYVWFFSATNAEAMFKVIDACSFNHSFWFYAGGLTDVQTVITVTDSLTGRVKTYTNPLGTAFKPIQDTSAFPCS